MLQNLDDTHIARATEFASVIVAVVYGISPALSAAIPVMPYFLVPQISMLWAFYSSLALGLLVLFTLGVFLARISDERPIVSGIQMIMVGIVTILIVALVAQ